MELTWTPALKIGNDLVDSQHIKLFRLFDEFAEGCAKGQARETLIALHASLREYAGSHFRDEEDLMQSSGYPELENHRRAHAVFLKDLQRLANQVSTEKVTLIDLVQTNKFLVSWLVNHVKNTDQRVGRFLNGLPPE